MQAKRLYNHFEKFKNIVLDFKGVEMIGEAFADELFRVFIHVTSAVSHMIKKA